MGQFVMWTDSYTSGSTTAQNNYATESFRQWAFGLHNMILSAGFAEVVVSGSIGHGGPCGDFTGSGGAIAGGFGFYQTGSTANLFAGFKIYQFNDPLQTVVPIFFKIGYGQGSSLAGAAVFLQAGTSHSDSPTGTLSGQTSSLVEIRTSLPTQFHIWDWYLSGNATSSVDPYITFIGPYSDITANTVASAQQNGGFFIERTKDATGAPDSNGFFVGTHDNGTTWIMMTVPSSGTIPGGDSRVFTAVGGGRTATLGSSNQAPTNRGSAVFSLVYPFHGISRNPATSMLVGSEQQLRDHDFLSTSGIYPNRTYRYMKTRLTAIRAASALDASAYMRCD